MVCPLYVSIAHTATCNTKPIQRARHANTCFRSRILRLAASTYRAVAAVLALIITRLTFAVTVLVLVAWTFGDAKAVVFSVGALDTVVRSLHKTMRVFIIPLSFSRDSLLACSTGIE